MTPVWLASYPKSGNTWLRQIFANLYSGKNEPVGINESQTPWGSASTRQAFEGLLLLDSSLLTYDEIDDLRPRVYDEFAREFASSAGRAAAPVQLIKVHDAYTLTQRGEPLLSGIDRAVLIVRDPRDIAASFANHIGATLDHAIARLNDPHSYFSGYTDRLHMQLRQKLLDWSGHAASWLDQTGVRTHVVRYEDLVENTQGAVTPILDFLGLAPGDEEVRRAVALSSFGKLQQQERESGFGEAPKHAVFFRQGKPGAWRDELTPEQTRRIEAAHATMMKRLGYTLSQ